MEPLIISSGAGAPMEVGTWPRPYMRIDAVAEVGDGFDTYLVLHGDAVPKKLVLRRYHESVDDSIDLVALARRAEVYDLWRDGRVIAVVGTAAQVAEFHRLLRG
jgi:hypothetical protein